MCPLHALSDAEVLATVIGPKTASHLLKTVGGSLAALLNESIAPYDVDPRVQTKLLAAKELVRRSLMESLRHRDCLGSPDDVRTYLKVAIGTREYEVFVVMFLDAQNRVIATEELFRGTLTQTAVYPREIVKRAMARNAAAVIFAHNHPSGLAEPSRADELLTGTLKQALALVDVKVLDHIVIGGEQAVSFAERGLL